MYLVGWLHFPILEEWSFAGDLLCLPAALSALVTSAMSSGAPPSGPCGSFSCDRLAVEGELVVVAGAGWAARTSLAQKLPETPGGPRASAGSQMGRVRF